MADTRNAADIAEIGATGCALAWATYIWSHLPSGVLAHVSRADLINLLAPLLVALNADHRAQLSHLAFTLRPPTDDDVPAGPTLFDIPTEGAGE